MHADPVKTHPISDYPHASRENATATCVLEGHVWKDMCECRAQSRSRHIE